jgi:hypothetical protein
MVVKLNALATKFITQRKHLAIIQWKGVGIRGGSCRLWSFNVLAENNYRSRNSLVRSYYF